jgi:aspartate racemase
MPTLGLVGGFGPESTVDYYLRIINVWQRDQPGSAPSMVIDSLDVDRAIQLVTHDRSALAEYLLDSLMRLAGAGADVAAITANTPHIVFDVLAPRSPMPLISIVETCADAAARQGRRRPLLLGTRFTMEAPFYPEVFARRGIEIATPDEADRGWVHGKYLGELLKGDFRDATRDGFVALIARLKDEQKVDAVILGGTELPLLLKSDTIAGLPALDTTALHVEAIVARLRTGAESA